MPLFKCLQLFWLKCWYSGKQHQTERLNSLCSQKAFKKVKREAKLSHKAATGTALHSSSTSVSLVSPWAWNFPFPRTRRAPHSALTMAQLLHAAPLDINKRCSQDFQSCWNQGNSFHSLQVMRQSSPHRDTKPRGGQKAAGGRSVLHLTPRHLCLCSMTYAAQSWPCSLMKVLLGMLRLLPCSAGLKQHQERKEQKALLHHWANWECPGSWTLHAVPVLHAQRGGDRKCYKVKMAMVGRRHTRMCRTLQVVEVSNKWETEGSVCPLFHTAP